MCTAKCYASPSMTIEEVRTLPALCRASDVARLTGMTLRAVQHKASKGELPCKKLGHRLLFNTAAILELCGLGSGCDAA